MKADSLQAAIHSLRISDVYLHKLDCGKSDDFENLSGAADKLIVNTRHTWTRMRAIEAQNDWPATHLEDCDTSYEQSISPADHKNMGEEDNLEQLLLVHYLTEFYVMNPVFSQESVSEYDSEKEDDVKKRSIAHVSAEFIAEYVLINPNVEPEALKKFCSVNVGYHVWPYWRELARSSAQRMRLPAPEFPFYTIPSNTEPDVKNKNRSD